MKEMTRNKIGKFKLGLLLLLVLLIGITLKAQFRIRAKEYFNSFFRPVQVKTGQINAYVASWEDLMNNLGSLQSRIEQLEQEKLKLLFKNTKLQDIKKENKKLREALEIDLQKNFDLELGRVVSKNQEQDQIIINKGTRNGVEKNMPVINSQKVLLGKVIEVGESFSRVRLISNLNSGFLGRIKGSQVEGEVKGQGNLKAKIDFIPQDKEIKVGQAVVTSQSGKSFPSGLLVGEITKVNQKDVDPFQWAKIKPYFDINDSILFIITNY